MTIAVSPQALPALVLNADYRPLSYYPLSLWSWQDAIKAVFLDRVNIIAEYEHSVCSPSFSMRLPSVVSLKTYVQPTRNPAFTRFNVFLRDGFDGASVDDIAREAGVSKATLYSYFPDKRLLFLEVAKTECARQADEAVKLIDQMSAMKLNKLHLGLTNKPGPGSQHDNAQGRALVIEWGQRIHAAPPSAEKEGTHARIPVRPSTKITSKEPS